MAVSIVETRSITTILCGVWGLMAREMGRHTWFRISSPLTWKKSTICNCSFSLSSMPYSQSCSFPLMDYFTMWSKLAQEWLISFNVFITAEETSSFLFFTKERPLCSTFSTSFSFVLIDSSNSYGGKKEKKKIPDYFCLIG